MTADQPSPLVLVALPGAGATQDWAAELEQSSCRVKQASPGEVEWSPEQLDRFDAVVVHAEALPQVPLPELRDILNTFSSCGVLVLSSDLAAMRRARLMAAGVRRVLDAEAPLTENILAVTAIAGAEAANAPECPQEMLSDVQPRLADFLSRSPFMGEFLEKVRKVADARATLLISGETGVGKERLARAIHAESGRSSGPFVAVNCGAVTASLAESELFGHVKGAFTGASQERRGPFEVAEGGTIFLDEIGEMAQDLQVRLLRVLERREVQRVGSEKVTRVDVRVMAATNQVLETAVSDGRFREDLLFRLNVVELRIPTLRERREDLPDLLGSMVHCLREVDPDYTTDSFEPEALQLLTAYDWPGNVRELINVVEHAMLLSEGNQIRVSSLPERVRKRAIGQAPKGDAPKGLKQARQEAAQKAELELLTDLLTRTHGDLNETARLADIGRRALFDRMRALGLHKEDFRKGSKND